MRCILSLTVLAGCVVGLAFCLPGLAQQKTPLPKNELSKVAQGNNQFAVDLYRQLARDAKPEENIFFSPYSIQAALAMTYAGARGETAEQMAQVLHFDRDQGKFHPAFAKLAQQLRQPGKDFKGTFNVANAIWTAVPVYPSFQQLMDRHYEAGLKPVGMFSEATRKEINGWVADKTREKIKELLPYGAVNSNTIMVLVNAIYFQANWKIAFDKKNTREEKFYRTPQEAVTVPMMHLNARLRYAKTEDVEIVELPYEGSRFSMVLLLPASHDKLAVVEKKLDQCSQWLTKLHPCQVELAMPKMNLRCQFRLAKTLQQMGMPLAGDFSAMSSDNSPISEVYHQATVEIDEAGTTAAAATAVVLTVNDSMTERATMNRPFLVILRDVQNDTFVFVGRVALPLVK